MHAMMRRAYLRPSIKKFKPQLNETLKSPQLANWSAFQMKVWKSGWVGNGQQQLDVNVRK